MKNANPCHIDGHYLYTIISITVKNDQLSSTRYIHYYMTFCHLFCLHVSSIFELLHNCYFCRKASPDPLTTSVESQLIYCRIFVILTSKT